MTWQSVLRPSCLVSHIHDDDHITLFVFIDDSIVRLRIVPSEIDRALLAANGDAHHSW
jgi:hypothetical protein